ncbi:MAG: Rap1a/Tai family immunity protein [bacterium]|nr:Rap1a/Tai family immunity protein [bacterium]
MKKISLVLAFLICMSSTYAVAGGVSFLGFCSNLEIDEDTLPTEIKAITISCVAFISGVTQTHSALVLEKKIKPLYCKPAIVTNGDIGRMYAKYVKKHPPRANLSESEILLEALQETYPCD